jgi:hypothetical protein
MLLFLLSKELKDIDAKTAVQNAVNQLTLKKEQLTNEITSFFKDFNNTVKIPSPKITEQELNASKKVPVNNEVLDAYFENRTSYITGLDLHSTMRAEVFNFVDGKRSYYDIYKAVKAESLAAGTWYYGKVSLSEVIKLLEANVKSGALKL